MGGGRRLDDANLFHFDAPISCRCVRGDRIAARLGGLSPPEQAADRGHHLFGALVLLARFGSDYKGMRVPIEQPECDLVERGLHSRDLGEDVDAVAVVVDHPFDPSDLPRPTRADIFSSIQVDYKLALNLLGLAIFAALFWLTARRGATDPVCGMKVDRARAVTTELGGQTYYFCSEHCLHAFEAGSHDARAYSQHDLVSQAQ
jgi:YHS domain-containing protein